MSRFPYENIEMQKTPHFSQSAQIHPWRQRQNQIHPTNKDMPSIMTQQQSMEHYNQDEQQKFSNQSAQWRPGFWRQFPYLSIFSLTAVLACIFATLWVLITSDGKPVEKWGYGIAPAVYLAVISVVTNVLLSLALVNGLVISFWRMALRGCTLDQINRNWHNGTSAWNALTRGYRKGGRITALACLLTVVGLLRGPLNQRASIVLPNDSFDTHGSLRLDFAQKLPDGYTGVNVLSRAPIRDTSRLTPVFNSVMQNYSARSEMTIKHANCGDSCKTTVKGFGFNTNCTTNDYTTTMPLGGVTYNVFVVSTTLYQIDNDTVAREQNWADTGIAINVTSFTNISSTQSSNSSVFSFRSHFCYLEPGIVSYDIELANGTVLLLNGTDNDSFEKIALTSPTPAGGNSTIGGFQYAMSYLWGATSTLTMSGAQISVALKGALANEMLIEDGNASGGFYKYRDPMNIMLDGIREIAFRTSLRAGADNATATNATQNVPYTGEGAHTIYVTNRKYMYSAAAVSFISFLAVAITFYGWWELGREMSMSPLEIAKAFDAPLLRHVGSNVPSSKMEESVLVTEVRYGESPRNGLPWNGPAGDQRGTTGSLRFGEHSRKPQKHQQFGS